MAKSGSMPGPWVIMFLVPVYVYISTTEGGKQAPSRSPFAQHAEVYFDRLNHSTHVITKCGVVTCPPGTQIRPCMENNTMDTCENCPEGTEMLDSTTSSQEVFPCQKKKICSDYEHAMNSTIENFCFHRTVRMHCKCDTQNGWCGEPCNCNMPPVSCKPGQLLLQDCSCVKDSSTEDTKTSSTPSTSTTDLTTEQTRGPTLDPATPLPSAPQSSNIITTEGTSHSSPTSERDFVQENNYSPEEYIYIYEDEVSWKTIGVGFGLFLLLAGLTLAALIKRDELKNLLGKTPPFKYCQYFRVSTSDN